MKTISSAEFRKTYQRLEEEVEVQANGHAIGMWRPYFTPQRIAGEFRIIERDTGDPATRVLYADRWDQPFRPVPKPGQRKK